MDSDGACHFCAELGDEARIAASTSSSVRSRSPGRNAKSRRARRVILTVAASHRSRHLANSFSSLSLAASMPPEIAGPHRPGTAPKSARGAR